jgi:cytidine deaminase
MNYESDRHIQTSKPISELSPHPISEISHARNLLLKELEKAYAPVTKRQVACLLQTDNELYSGHNYEYTNPIHFDHAEENALKKMPQDKTEKIQKVFLAGKGNEKMKRVTPCSECYDALSPHFSTTTEFILFQPDTLEATMTFSFTEHNNAYVSKPYSSISGSSREEILKQLKEKTLLQNEGLGLVADLRLMGLDKKIHFYLTGSASGRGSMGTLIHLKQGTSYNDIDIVAVTELDRGTTEKLTEEVMWPHFGKLEKKKTVVDVWFINEIRKQSHYFLGEKEILDLTVAPTLRDGMIRMDYLKKNFFHQIS